MPSPLVLSRWEQRHFTVEVCRRAWQYCYHIAICQTQWVLVVRRKPHSRVMPCSIVVNLNNPQSITGYCLLVSLYLLLIWSPCKQGQAKAVCKHNHRHTYKAGKWFWSILQESEESEHLVRSSGLFTMVARYSSAVLCNFLLLFLRATFESAVHKNSCCFFSWCVVFTEAGLIRHLIRNVLQSKARSQSFVNLVDVLSVTQQLFSHSLWLRLYRKQNRISFVLSLLSLVGELLRRCTLPDIYIDRSRSLSWRWNTWNLCTAILTGLSKDDKSQESLEPHEFSSTSLELQHVELLSVSVAIVSRERRIYIERKLSKIGCTDMSTGVKSLRNTAHPQTPEINPQFSKHYLLLYYLLSKYSSLNLLVVTDQDRCQVSVSDLKTTFCGPESILPPGQTNQWLFTSESIWQDVF